MTLERIRSHILEQAKSKADEMVRQTELKAADRLKQAEHDETARLESDLADLERDLTRTRQQELAKQRTSDRADVLRLKTDILNEVFARASEKVLAGQVYRDWLLSKLREVGSTSAQIICRPEDRDMLSQLLGEVGVNGLSFAEDARPPRGGFLLRTEKYDVDVTLKAELTDLREELTPELVERLPKEDAAGEQD